MVEVRDFKKRAKEGERPVFSVFTDAQRVKKTWVLICVS